MKLGSSSSDSNKSKSGKRRNSGGRSYSTSPGHQQQNGISTPPSPRRPWVKFGGSARSRSVENLPPLGPSPRSKSPPLTLSPHHHFHYDDSSQVQVSPLDTPPRKAWESNFRSFLSRRSQQQQQQQTEFPPVPILTPLQQQQHEQQQNEKRQQKKSTKNPSVKDKNNSNNDHSVRGGKFFSSIFGGGGSNGSSTASNQQQQKSYKPRRRKTKSLNELDQSIRNGKTSNDHDIPENYTPAAPPYRRAASSANVVSKHSGNDELNQTMRRAVYTGSSAGAIVPPSPNAPPKHHVDIQTGDTGLHSQHLNPPFFPQHHLLPPQRHPNNVHYQQNHSFLTTSNSPAQDQLDVATHRSQPPLPYIAPLHAYQHGQQRGCNQHQQEQQHSLATQPASASTSNPSPSSHSMSPSSATTEIKKAFTEFHNSSLYAKDSTSAYLGDEPSTRGGKAHPALYNPGLVAQSKFGTVPQQRHLSGSIGSPVSHRLLSSSLPTVDENVSIHKSMRMLRPFQTVDSWQSGRRYLIGPAAMAASPMLQGITSFAISACHCTREIDQISETENTINEVRTAYKSSAKSTVPTIAVTEKDVTSPSPTKLPPLFGCIVLGKALLSYVIQEPAQHHQQRWWSSCTLVLRQNFLFEYDQQKDDVLQGLPRGYAHLQYSKSYAHPDFVDALELEFYVSPCAKADQRVLTIRLEEAREDRENWIACLNRAAQTTVKDLYDYDDNMEVGRGRYATIYPAKRRKGVTKGNEKPGAPASQQSSVEDTSLSDRIFRTSTPHDYDCALKIIDKKEFWRRVVKGRERADTLVREVSVQATMTARCAKIPAFVRIRGFFETSDHVVLELDLLDGVDLFQYVSSKGILPEKEAALIVRDILTVLDGMNRAGIAHRDVKPANCLMSKIDPGSKLDKVQCVVKVADFGMATFVGVDGLVRGRCGTPGYVAPEIFLAGVHGGYGNKVDVFSAGVTLYVMLCGYEPFYGESDTELVAMNKEAKLCFPESDWKHVSMEAKDLVKRMMDPHPEQRVSAKEALGHDWILQHAGATEAASVVSNSGVDALSHSLHSKGEACIIS